MVKKELLHQLISSLSKSEKRYFTLFCQREASGSNYLRLFKAIEQQEVYDEKKIKEQFEGETFVKQLHVTKNYLRRLILKSLRNFHERSSRDAQLKEVLRNVEILYNKELFELCKYELDRARDMAETYELLTGIVEVTHWRRKLEQTLKPHQYDVFQEALDDQKEAIAMLENTNDYWQEAVSVSRRMFRYGEDEGVIEQDSPTSPPLTLEAEVLHFNTKYLQQLQAEDEVAAEAALRTLIARLEARPRRVQEDPGLYVSSINNLISFLVFTKQYEEALLLIQKAKKVYDRWRITSENRTLLKQILRTFNVELEIYRTTREVSQHIDFITNTESFVNVNKHKMPKSYLLSFWFQLASVHFIQEDFSRALHWVNKVLNARFKDVRTDLQVQAQLLNLMIHLEQQNLMVLRYYVDSARRYMRKVKEVQEYEQVLLRFFTKIGRLPLLDYKEAFKALHVQLFPSEEASLIPSNTVGYIDFEHWILKKI